MYGADGVALLGELKRIWDPAGVLNPGMIVDPPQLDLAIRHDGPAKDRRMLTIFAYPDDEHDFAQAQRRCVGIGKCRQSSGSVMCPSYQVTRDELHSTRGRAHLLWEMLAGRPDHGRVAVDRGTRRAGPLPVVQGMSVGLPGECRRGDVQGGVHPPPLRATSVGAAVVALVDGLAAAVVPPRVPGAAAVANRFAGLQLTKRLGGIAAEREVPPFAPETFTHWFTHRNSPGSGGGRRVVLWPDTFTNYLAPEIGRAAVAVLEAAGYEVVLPAKPVCCGLTWISTGQLTTARRVLNRSLRVLAPHLQAGTPIVGLEPSCTAAFRHDAPALLADNPLAASAAANTRTFSELLAESGWQPPYVGGAAYVQPHCHQHAVLGFDADRKLMAAAGIEADLAEPGCCGLAGNFGFERGHYDDLRGGR